MSEGKDPAIKLFGKTIQLPEDLPVGICSQDVVSGESDDNNKAQTEENSIDKEEDGAHSTISEEFTELNATSIINENPKTPSAENESTPAKSSKSEEQQNDENTLKKPDKLLPCPRCKSMDTKFCYYNNYNANQPRHFCKKCQRYWTAGGSMRNVPVGAGRRKNKTPVSQYHQITVTESLPSDPNHTVLTFGSNTPRCESMVSVSKITEKTNKSSVTEMQNVPCFPHGSWPYPWNPQMGPAFCPPGFVLPFYPPYWGCAVPVPMPWVPPPCNYHPAPSPSGPVSPTLGKHSRDQNGEEEPGTEKRVWIPKTLRIDDPDEAAKSSIWATLGIKKDGFIGGNGRGVFKAFESKGEEKSSMKETFLALQANPAALSRSLNFQESS